MLNASYLPNPELVEIIKGLTQDQAVFNGDHVIAFYVKEVQNEVDFNDYEVVDYDGELLEIHHTWDIFSKNDEAIRQDFELLTKGRVSEPIPDSVNTIASEHIFIEKGAKVQFATLNASSGPIYIGEHAEVMEGSLIRGPLALCEHSVIKMGAKIYGATSIGPHSKVGGEISNSVLFGYSNKGHEGFIGNTVIGEWCNLGADTNTSNLKNNYAEVRLWDYQTERFEPTGLQFCGLMMGDHSKCGINTMFNTGTVIGVNANIFGSGYPRNFIASFSWGGSSGFTTYQTKKAFEVAEVVMARRKIEFSKQDRSILEKVFEITSKYRKD